MTSLSRSAYFYFRSPLVGEHARHWRAEGGEQRSAALHLAPLPSPPPQGGRGEQAAMSLQQLRRYGNG
jgi:hypothetical protein